MILFIGLIVAPVYSQLRGVIDPVSVPSPDKETFVTVDAVASPTVIGECPDKYYYPDMVSDCREYTLYEYGDLNQRLLYNGDGSLWYKYQDRRGALKYYRSDFLPFGAYSDIGRNAILKIFGESEHWYEVEVDARTNATKYLLKSDPNWAKKSWDFWLAKMMVFKVNPADRLDVYDKPDGKVIENSSKDQIANLSYVGKRSGDWIAVGIMRGRGLCLELERTDKWCRPGWVRWRVGRDFALRGYGGFVSHYTLMDRENTALVVPEN
jgi:hypothetical protein